MIYSHFKTPLSVFLYNYVVFVVRKMFTVTVSYTSLFQLNGILTFSWEKKNHTVITFTTTPVARAKMTGAEVNIMMVN